jgi:hypothetical protein
MYQTPVLERYGTLRDLTAQFLGDNAKRPSIDDLATVNGGNPGGNDGCNLHAQPWSHAGCPS